MKKWAAILSLLITTGAWAQGWNLQLLSHFNDTSLARIDKQIWNECTGYADTVNHREYAIAGSVDSIYFFDITNPTVMKKCDVESGITHGINRDMEVYEHYVYCVSDNLAPGSQPGLLQIFDLQYLPDSVHKVYQSDETGRRTHTIFINRQSKRLYKCINYNLDTALNTVINPIEVYSLRDPLHPAFMAKLTRAAGFADVHESYVRNDTVYCSSGNAGLFIYDMTDTAHIRLLGSITPPYPENAYNHSNWLDSSGRYMLFTDETPDGKGMKIYDISDLSNPRLVGNPFRDAGSPHNAYWYGRFAFTSMYYGGVNIYDLGNMTAPRLVASYATFSQPHTGNVYEGCWGVYPFLPSGNIIASDMNTGIYLLRPSVPLDAKTPGDAFAAIHVFPNPVFSTFTITLQAAEKQQADLLVYDLQGKIAAERTLDLHNGENEWTLDELQHAAPGLYVVKLVSAGGVYYRSLIKQ